MNNDRELQDIFENLPDAMAARLISPDMVEKVKRIGEIHGLPDDQIDILQTIMALALLDKLSFDDIDKEIDNDIIADDTQLVGIKKDIDEQIILPFINELKDESGNVPNLANPDRPTSRKTQQEKDEDAEVAKMLKDAHSEVVEQAPVVTTTTALADSKEEASMPLVVPQQPASAPAQPTSISTPSIIDSRLNNAASLPKEDMVITEDKDQTISTSNPPKKTYDGADPYREPIE